MEGAFSLLVQLGISKPQRGHGQPPAQTQSWAATYREVADSARAKATAQPPPSTPNYPQSFEGVGRGAD